MSSVRRLRARLLLFALILGPPPLLTGCGESTQSGTQVQLSEEAKAQIQSRREMYSAKKVVKKSKSTRK